MVKKRIFLIIFIFLLLVGIGFWAGVCYKKNQKPVSESRKPGLIGSSEEECLIEAEERIVRGDSLSPRIKPGQTVRVLFGYYDCHPVEREDVVTYSYAGNKNPIIKIVKGIPGDSFELKETESGWNILINGQVLKNSENQPYLVTGNRYKMLSLYEDDCRNGIPRNTYLILGNLINGSMDSSCFGLVSKNDILGKVSLDNLVK